MKLYCHPHASRSEPVVALTFDDGPNPPVTDRVLDILRGAGAKASFFVMGRWVERWPHTLRRIVDEGHDVANHTHTHQWGLGDYERAEAAIFEVIGVHTRFARPPAFDYASCTQSGLVTSGALTLIDADVNPSDWSCNDPALIASRVLDSPSLQGGSIVDLHDGFDQDDNAVRISRPAAMLEALPVILAGLRDRGLTPVPLSAMVFNRPREIAKVEDTETHRVAQGVARERAR